MDQRKIEPCSNVKRLIYILGIDGLEYDLVEKFNLNNLKQINYGKVLVPINKLKGIPLSPEVWTCFLIGRIISKDFERSGADLISYYFKEYFKKILKFLNIDLHKKIFLKIYSLALKFFSQPKKFGNLKQKTFLDITESKKINAPYYNFDNKTFQISFLFGRRKLSLEQTVEKTKSLYEHRKKQILKEIDDIGDENIVFAFIHTTDMLQHVSFLHVSEIKQYYIDLDNYVSILKSNLEDSFGEIIFIIVSDHGFDFNIGNHSNYGFYSSNIHLIPKPEKITDFYKIILDLVNEHNGVSH